MSSRTLWLCGAGNPEGVRLALRVNEREQAWERIAVLDDDPKKKGSSILGVEVAGPFEALADVEPGSSELVNLVAKSTTVRQRVRERLAAFQIPFTSLVHHDVDTLGAELGEAVTVYKGATVSARSRVGDHSVLFSGSNAGHGSRLGEGCVLAPGAVVNARVELGELCYVGCNASILPDLKLGARVVVGAGSSVLENVPDGATLMGVPARVILQEGLESTNAPVAVPDPQAAPADAQMEKLVASAWSEALNRPEVGRDENFFDLGGSSLLALRVRERLEQATGQTLQATDLYRFPTVWALAAHLGRGGTASPAVRAAEARGRARRRRQVGA